MNKKTFAVYGNCQASPIAKLLLNNETFNAQFELVNFAQPVFMMSNKDWPHIHEVVSNVDLLICQKVGNAFGDLLSTENLFANIKPGAIKISYPSIYFDGYFREVDYIRGLPPSINQFSEYHDLNVAKNFVELKDVGQAKRKSIEQMLDTSFCSENTVLQGVQSSISELKMREETLDTKISSFIEEHWREEQLFFSVNHPSRRVLLEVCDQILTLLGISDRFIPGSYEHLGETILPVYQAVKSQMNSTTMPTLKVKGKDIQLESYVESSLSVYASHDYDVFKTTIRGLWEKKHLN